MFHEGRTVDHIMNITDVDDKIVERAGREHVVWTDIAKKYTVHFIQTMNALNVLPPDALVNATDHIDDIVDIIKDLLEKELAYVREGSVYFDYNKYIEKGLPKGPFKDTGDNFVLWKASTDEPYWKTPFGTGRPGWHIECTSIINAYFGEHITHHGKGIDLRFPHHNNETLQAHAYHGSPTWCDHFFHV